MEHSVNGVVDLPKEYGMFIAKGFADDEITNCNEL